MVEKALIFYRKYFKRKPYGWSGDYDTWQQALENCSGYEAANILEKVKEATLKVQRGEAVFERDSVLFHHPQFAFPLLSAVMWVALKKNSSLKVIDFGGSLGSTYFQNRFFLREIRDLQWNIIEQNNFVEAGKKLVEDERLRFFPLVEEAFSSSGADILIIACAIQYMEKPYELLHKLMAFNIPYVLLDNTPFNYQNRDRISIQKVPPSIYSASYPCWFLDYEHVKKVLSTKYQVVSEHNNEDVIELDGRQIPYKGLLLELKK
jgi:putative methyltransferase (TIGR04325 family)